MPRVATTRIDPQFNYLRHLCQGGPVFTADYYSVDGGTGKVASFIDWNDPSHLLAQSSGALQVAIPAAHADFINKLCANFTGAEYYDSNRPQRDWATLHNGQGAGVYGVATCVTSGTRRLLNTRAGAGNLGWFVGVDTTPNLTHGITTGAGVTIASSSQAITAGVPIQFTAQYKEGLTPAERAFKVTGVTEAAADSAAAPDPTIPAATLRFGARSTTNDLFFIGRVWGFAFTPALELGQRTQIRAILATLTGVAA